jgi:menaquinone-dependent protoporphyrinogen oxidase
MPDKILVTYASRTGATEGVARAIGETMAGQGLQVEVLSMKDVTDPTPYRAVVAGSAVQGQKWLPEAIEFLQAHQAVLSGKPCAVFSVCMTLAMKNGEKYRRAVSEWLKPVRKIVKPVSEGLFAGVLDISKIPSAGNRLKFRLSVLFGVWKQGDHRNWDAIHSWARELKLVLAG